MGAAERIAIDVNTNSTPLRVVGDAPTVSVAELARIQRELGRACSGNAVITSRGSSALARFHAKQQRPVGRRS